MPVPATRARNCCWPRRDLEVSSGPDCSGVRAFRPHGMALFSTLRPKRPPRPRTARPRMGPLNFATFFSCTKPWMRHYLGPLIRPLRLAVRTHPFHGCDTGSSPVGVATLNTQSSPTGGLFRFRRSDQHRQGVPPSACAVRRGRGTAGFSGPAGTGSGSHRSARKAVPRGGGG